MIPSNCYGHSILTWLLYFQLPCWFGTRLYIVCLNEADFALPVPFLQDHYLRALNTRTTPCGGVS